MKVFNLRQIVNQAFELSSKELEKKTGIEGIHENLKDPFSEMVSETLQRHKEFQIHPIIGALGRIFINAQNRTKRLENVTQTSKLLS